MKRKIIAALGSLALVVSLAACTANHSDTAQKSAQSNSDKLQSQVYIQKNNVEFNNYNKRQQVSDDPATILWCTAYLDNPNVPPITYPIVGKLTSSSKRPYPTTQVAVDAGDTTEVPGPDSMYGTSSEYRYGFTPGGVYVDFTGVSTICTTEPTVYQATKTTIVLQTDASLNAASVQAHAALQAGQQANGTISQAASDKAATILQNQINTIQAQASASAAPASKGATP